MLNSYLISVIIFMKKNPPILLLFISLILFVFSLIVFKFNYATDIRLHDTYVEVAHVHILWILAIIIILLWLVYLIAKSLVLSKPLIWAHVIITITSLIFVTITLFGEPATALSENNQTYFIKVITICVYTFLAAQCILIFNIGKALLRKIKNK